MQTLEFNVTQKNINEGIQGNPYMCAVAKSIKENFPELEGFINVQHHGCQIGEEKFYFDEETEEKIREFDACKENVKPFHIKTIGVFEKYPLL